MTPSVMESLKGPVGIGLLNIKNERTKSNKFTYEEHIS